MWTRPRSQEDRGTILRCALYDSDKMKAAKEIIDNFREQDIDGWEFIWLVLKRVPEREEKDRAMKLIEAGNPPEDWLRLKSEIEEPYASMLEKLCEERFGAKKKSEKKSALLDAGELEKMDESELRKLMSQKNW